jgi:hypothetical protein
LTVVKGEVPSVGGQLRRSRLAPERLAELDRLLGDPHLSRNEIVRRSGVSRDAVTRRAATIGRVFGASIELTAARAAGDRKATDGRSKRRELAERLLADALGEASLRDQLDRREVRDAAARAALSRSLGTLVKAVADLDGIELRWRELDRDKRQSSELDEWLEHMTGTE